MNKHTDGYNNEGFPNFWYVLLKKVKIILKVEPIMR